MSEIRNATDPGHLDSERELESPTTANAITRAQATAQNESSQSEPNNLQQMAGPSNIDAINIDSYQLLTKEEVPSDQQWLKSIEELEKTLTGMLGANCLAASTTADPTLRKVRDCVWNRRIGTA